MEHLKAVLSEAVGSVCQQLLMYNSALKYESLLAITVDNVTALIFNLQGYAGSTSTEMTAWSRRPSTESAMMKSSIEQALMKVCWEKVAEVSTIKLEGLLTVVLDNTEVLIVGIDKTAFSPEIKGDNFVSKSEQKDVSEQIEVAIGQLEQNQAEEDESTVNQSQEQEIAVSQSEEQEVALSQSEPQEVALSQSEQQEVPASQSEQAVVGVSQAQLVTLTQLEENDIIQSKEGLSEDEGEGDTQNVIMVVMADQQEGGETTATVVTAEELDQAAIGADGTKWTSLLSTEWEGDDQQTATDIFKNKKATNFEAATTLSELALAAQKTQNQRITEQAKGKLREIKPAYTRNKKMSVCSYCSRGFPNTRALVRHMKVGHDIKQAKDIFGSVKCLKCDKTFFKSKSMRRHNCINKCTKCEFVGKTKKDLKNHEFRYHQLPQPNADNTINCPVCHKVFSNYARMRDHLSSHMVESLSNLALRKLMDMDDQRLKKGCTCILCDKKFDKNSWHMKRHMSVHHAVKGHLDALNIISQSPVCSDPSRWSSLIHGKVKSLSKLSLAMLARPCTKTSSEYKCQLCGTSRLSSFYILRHMERHLEHLKKGLNKNIYKRAFSCLICLNKFTSEQTLEMHKKYVHRMNNVEGRPRLVCEFCGTVFYNVANLDRHMALHRFRSSHGEKWKPSRLWQCKSCNHTFTSEASMNKHNIDTHHLDVNVQPLNENFEFEIEEDVTVNVKVENVENIPGTSVHTLNADQIKQEGEGDEEATTVVTLDPDKVILTCTICNKEFKEKMLLLRHMKSHTKSGGGIPRNFKCDRCDTEFVYESSLKKHLRDCTVGRAISQRFFCEICQYYLGSKYSLDVHNKNCHNPLVSPKNFINSEIMCDICGANMSSRKALVRHKNNWHNPDKPKKPVDINQRKIICDICGARLHNKTNLRRHMRRWHDPDDPDRNEGLKRHICGHCGEMFMSTSAFQGHLHEYHNPSSPPEKEAHQVSMTTSEMDDQSESILNFQEDQSNDCDDRPIIDITPEIKLLPIDEEDSEQLNFIKEEIKKETRKFKASKSTKKDENTSEDDKKIENTSRRMSKRTPKATYKVLEGDGFSKKHKNDEWIECDQCGILLSGETSLKRHIDKVHCPEKKAKNTPAKKPGLKRKSSSQDSTLQCPDCEMTCSSSNNLQRHITRWHGNQNLASQAPRNTENNQRSTRKRRK